MSLVFPFAKERIDLALVTVKGEGPEVHESRKNYFREEYTLDYYIATYPKPMIAIMDGITSPATT